MHVQQAKETVAVGTQLFELTRSVLDAVWSAGACTRLEADKAKLYHLSYHLNTT